MMKLFIQNSLFFAAAFWAANSVAQELAAGTVIGRHIFGMAIDYQGDPLIIQEKPLIYDSSDYSASLTIDSKTFAVSNFNHVYGGIYVTRLEAKTDQPIDTVALNLENVDGLYSPGGGLVTAWKSIMLSESELIDGANPEEFAAHFKAYYKGKSGLINPYNYGWISEVVVLNAEGEAKVIKNYAIGRLFATQILLMPDNKTLYFLDSIGNLYLFIAEQPNSMAKGSLYAINKNAREIKHTLLGSSSALKVKFKLKKLDFESLFQVSAVKDNACSKKYTFISTIYGDECLKMNSKNKKYVSLFEPIRFLAIQGLKPITDPNSKIQFNHADSAIIIKKNNKADVSYRLSADNNLNSQYVVKESL